MGEDTRISGASSPAPVVPSRTQQRPPADQPAPPVAPPPPPPPADAATLRSLQAGAADAQVELPGEAEAEVPVPGIRDLAQRFHVDESAAAQMRDLLDSFPPAKRPAVMAMFQSIGDRGRLDGRLIEQLAALRDPDRTPLAEGVDRGSLFIETIQDLANPAQIGQGQWGTCMATVVQASLALDSPARYVQILRALASPAGDASTLDGETLVPGLHRPRDQDLSRPDCWPQMDGASLPVGTGTRSLTVRLISPAFMDYAGGGNVYLNASDLHDHPGTIPDHGGLLDEEQRRLLENVLRLEVDPIRGDQSEVLRRLADGARRGHIVPVFLSWPGGLHGVLYLGKTTTTDPDTGRAREYALLLNPHGQRQAIPFDTFQARLAGAQIPVGIPGCEQEPIPRPADWDRFETYTLITDDQLLTTAEVLSRLPGLTALTPDNQGGLHQFVHRSGMNRVDIQVTLGPLLASGRLNNEVMDMLQAVASRHGTGKVELEDALFAQIRNFININATLDYTLQGNSAFQALAEETRLPALAAARQVLDLLMEKEATFDKPTIQGIAALAVAGRLTPDFLAELQGKADAAGIVETIQRAALEMTPSSGRSGYTEG